MLKVKHNIETFRNPNQYGDLWKMPHLRKETDFFEGEGYDEANIAYNSPYDTIFYWEKQGIGVKRPIKHYLNPRKIYYLIKRKLQKK